jgi:hypothetical protein
MEQITELLKTQFGFLASKMDAHHEEIMAGLKRINATADAWLKKTEAHLKEEEEPAPEEIEAVEKSQEGPEGATSEETIGAAKDRSKDLRLAVGCHGKVKTRTKRDGGSRQECATAVGRPTHRAIPAMRKGRVRRVPGKKRRSGLKGRGNVSHTRKRGRILKRDRRLDRKKMHSEAIRKSLHMETAKLIFESSIRLRKPGDVILWKCWPPPKRKRLWAVCVPALQEHRPPPGVHPL